MEFARIIEERLAITPVQPCFLELARPTILEGMAALYRRGVLRSIVTPMQLTAGRHVRFDIPCEVGRSLTDLSSMSVCFTEHLGGHPQLIDIADLRVAEALSGRPAVESTALVLVARGSRDPLVRGEILRFAEMRRIEDQMKISPCFLAMASPSFEETLDQVISENPARVVVQPHLLLPGRLLLRIHRLVSAMAERFPQIEWITAGSLGPDPRLAKCALELALDGFERDRRPPRALG
jgi:sirohydrochlorin cobaltochelatase